ncbi:hypothetical protein MIS33_08570 [Wielerella bovis]|uniref:hypothetical protein n=1 Tax=Wielerella bovis TaxID=2917790 RepID=UPI002018679B|nr:hypothetical protein [Wielerella bovis]ULJ64203.1 hypothetical protein MIS33_08570 [Wielerella bovis]
MENICTTEDVIELWTLPHRKPPSITTIWRRTREGKIPKPRKIGNVNLYDRREVIRLRDEALGVTK